MAIKEVSKFKACKGPRSDSPPSVESSRAKSTAIDPDISGLIAGLVPSRMRDVIEELTRFRTRYTYSPRIGEVSDWLHRYFVGLGYRPDGEVRFHEFTLADGLIQRNVICQKGAARSSPIILIGAHFDSISENPDVLAPGADDNATGVAVLLELARILKDIPLRKQMFLAAFAAEEQGLFGSAAYAQTVLREGPPVELMVNIDMVGFPEDPGEFSVVVEYDQGNASSQNDAAAERFGRAAAQAVVDYTTLRVRHTDIWNSDYMPFEQRGFAAIGFFETGPNPHQHRSSDTAANINSEYVTEVAKAALAVVLKLAR